MNVRQFVARQVTRTDVVGNRRDTNFYSYTYSHISYSFYGIISEPVFGIVSTKPQNQ